MQHDVFLRSLEIGEGRVGKGDKIEIGRRRRRRIQAFEFLDPVEPPMLRLRRAGIGADEIIHATEDNSERHDLARRAGAGASVIGEAQHLHAKQSLTKVHKHAGVFRRPRPCLHGDALRAEQRFDVRFRRAPASMTRRRADFPLQARKRLSARRRACVA